MMALAERRDRAADILADGVLRLLAREELVEVVADEDDESTESRPSDGGLYRVSSPTAVEET